VTRVRPTYRCHTCGEVFSSWATAEQHADDAHHTRIEIQPTLFDQPAAVVDDVPTGGVL
jgi:hypothetical protein